MTRMSFSTARKFFKSPSPLPCLCGLLIALYAVPSRAAEPFSLAQLGFYEGERNTVAPDWGNAGIKTPFPRNRLATSTPRSA